MTLKLGVIGTGAIGQEHIRRCNNVLQGAKVVAVSDINVEGARAALQRLNIQAEGYQDGHQVINSPEVDAVLVTSWDPTHEEFTLAAIAAGAEVVDGALGGLGGCPFAPGASGNTSSEDILFATRPDWLTPERFGELVQLSERLLAQLGEPNRSKSAQGARSKAKAFEWVIPTSTEPSAAG